MCKYCILSLSCIYFTCLIVYLYVIMGPWPEIKRFVSSYPIKFINTIWEFFHFTFHFRSSFIKLFFALYSIFLTIVCRKQAVLQTCLKMYNCDGLLVYILYMLQVIIIIFWEFTSKLINALYVDFSHHNICSILVSIYCRDMLVIVHIYSNLIILDSWWVGLRRSLNSDV